MSQPGTANMVEDTLLLRDGRSVAVRVATAADAPRIQALFARLSAESLAMRFGEARGPLGAGEVLQMAAAPGPHGLGLVALADAGAERIVALCRLERTPGAAEAEMSVAVDDAWHGLGLGTGLLERLIDLAAADGLDGLWGSIRPGNAAMLRVLHDLGARLSEVRHQEEILVRLPVPADEGLEIAGTARFAVLASSHSWQLAISR